MKRRDLIRHLEVHGCELRREGGNHSVYVNRTARKTSTVPRHREVDDFLARKTCLAQKVRVTDDTLIMDLIDGRTLSVSLAWYSRRAHGTARERSQWELIGRAPVPRLAPSRGPVRQIPTAPLTSPLPPTTSMANLEAT